MGEKAPPPRPPPLPSPSTRGKFLHNTYNISTAAHRASQVVTSGSGGREVTSVSSAAAPVYRPFAWTSDEHARFVAALEQFGAARATSAHAAWFAIAAAVRSRSVAEVKAHAAEYLAMLQAAPLGGDSDEQWTAAQDAAFEQLLAAYSNVLTGYPWAEMAAQVPGKSPQELQQRYFELCDDISRIESYGSLHGVGKTPRTRRAADGCSSGEWPKAKTARWQPEDVLPALTSPLIASGVSFSFLPLPSPFTPRLHFFSAPDDGDAACELTRMPSPTSRADAVASSLPALPTPTHRQPSPMFFPPPPPPFGLTPGSAATSTSRPTRSSQQAASAGKDASTPY